MMTPNQLAERIYYLTQGDHEERQDIVVFHSPLSEITAREEWLKIRSSPPPFLSKVHIFVADSDGELQESSVPVGGETFRITLHKTTVVGELRLLFSSSIVKACKAVESSNCIQIGDMPADETFSTYYSRFQPWTLDEVTPYAPSEPLADPRNFVKDFTGMASVPADPRPWLLRTAPKKEGDSYAAWRKLAARKLLAILSDQVSVHDNIFIYNFTGPPSQSISLSDEQAESLAKGLQAGAGWVLTEGRDADTRHLLFANEWARAYRTEQLQNVCDRSLESARSAYSAYVKTGSRETLKALAELRKAVIEETQKVSQRAQDLAGALWKDIAVAAVPFVLKIFGDSVKIDNRLIAGSIAFAAAVFLAFSFGIQVYINHRYFKHQDDSRTLWWQVLNNVLAKDEVERFSVQPVVESVNDYKRVRLLVGLFYSSLIVVLIVFGTVNLKPQTPSPTQPVARASSDLKLTNTPPPLEATSVTPTTAPKASSTIPPTTESISLKPTNAPSIGASKAIQNPTSDHH